MSSEDEPGTTPEGLSSEDEPGTTPEGLTAYWTAAYLRVEGAMFSVAIRLLGSESFSGESAADVVSQACVEVIEKFHGAMPDCDPGCELISRTRWRALDLLRGSERFAGIPMVERKSGDEPIEDVVERAVIATAALQRLDVLNEKQRYVLREHVVKGRSATEVAKELGCSPQRVGQLLREAARRLRAALEDRNEGTGGMEVTIHDGL